MKIDLPLFVMLPRKTKADKRIALNMNTYRNLHYQLNNQAKKEFCRVIAGDLLYLPCLDMLDLKYTLYPKTKRLTDVANVCSIVDKFFCDALVRAGKIEDDNFNFIRSVWYGWGKVDKDNPRCEVRF